MGGDHARSKLSRMKVKDTKTSTKGPKPQTGESNVGSRADAFMMATSPRKKFKSGFEGGNKVKKHRGKISNHERQPGNHKRQAIPSGFGKMAKDGKQCQKGGFAYLGLDDPTSLDRRTNRRATEKDGGGVLRIS